MDTAIYKEEVLGQRVSILFEIDGGDAATEQSSEFYSGSITKMLASFDQTRQSVSYQHLILFDDGDEHWFDLCVEEEAGRLEWPTTAVAAAAIKKEECHTAAVITKEEINTSIDDEVPPNPVLKKMKLEEEESPAKMESKKDVGSEQADDVEHDFPPLPDPLPKSIDGIIRLMDELEPDQGYFDRQADNRGGCSGTRGKLRAFARKNPGHAAVEHWVETGSWQPPNETTFHVLAELLKTMIK